MISFQYKKKKFDKLLVEIMNGIQKISSRVDFNNLKYYFKNLNLAPIDFIGFKGPLHIFEETKISNISIQKADQDQKQFK